MFLESDGDGARLAARARALRRARRRRRRAQGRRLGGRGAGRRRPTPARSPATSGSSARWSRRPAPPGRGLPRAAGARPVARRAAGAAARRGGLAVLTCSGGDSGIAADEAERLGAELPALAPDDRERARRAAAGSGDDRQPARLHGDDLGRHRAAAAIAVAVGDDPAIDQLLLLYDHPQGLAPRRPRAGQRSARGSSPGAAETGGRDARRLDPPRPDRRRGERASSPRAACPRSPGCARRWPARGRSRRPPADPARLRAIAAAAGAARRATHGRRARWLDEATAKELLRAGVCRCPRAGSTTARAPARRGARIGWPVALKVSAPGLPTRARPERSPRRSTAGAGAGRRARAARRDGRVGAARACWSSGWRPRASS